MIGSQYQRIHLKLELRRTRNISLDCLIKRVCPQTAKGEGHANQLIFMLSKLLITTLQTADRHGQVGGKFVQSGSKCMCDITKGRHNLLLLYAIDAVPPSYLPYCLKRSAVFISVISACLATFVCNASPTSSRSFNTVVV